MRKPIEDEAEIEDPLGEDVYDTLPGNYEIRSYGADYPVESIVERFKRGDIIVPAFQRGFVWSLKQSSRFIETLLMGLPVPSVFLAREGATSRLLVVDGQQRLRTLVAFYTGTLPGSKKPFRLDGVLPQYRGLTYKTLDIEARRRLDDSIIHAIIFEQMEPADDYSSYYLLFERLNTGGTALRPQEIRTAVFHGPLADLLERLNHNAAWRSIIGPVRKDLRDQELILRFLALRDRARSYSPPMTRFLNSWMAEHRELSKKQESEVRSVFERCIEAVHSALGDIAFKPRGVINAAVFDAVMVGVAHYLHERGEPPAATMLRSRYEALLADPAFIRAVSQATASPPSLHERIELAIRAFG